MKMKKTAFFCAVVILLTAASCTNPGEERTSTPSENTSSAVSDVDKQEEKEFDFAGAKMGMTAEQAKSILSIEGEPHIEDGRAMYGQTYSSLYGLPEDLAKGVVFVFSKEDKLEEIQYIVEKKDNVPYADMVAYFKTIAGDCSEVDKDGRKSTTWLYRGVILNVVEMDSENYAVTFYEKQLFIRDFPDEYQAFTKETGLN